MKKLTLIFTLLFSTVIFPIDGFSAPIWEISSRWSCIQVLHSVISLDGKLETINRHGNTRNIDFSQSELVSIFSNGNKFTGKIVPKFYVHNPLEGNESVLVVDWGKTSIGKRTMKIIEKNYEFWTSATSGYGNKDKKLWSNHSRCHPIK